MPSGTDHPRSRTLTAESVLDGLEEILAREGKEARRIGTVRHAERHTLPGYERAMVGEPLGPDDIPDLLQEALEEETDDRKLTRACLAMGLLMGALSSRPHK